LDSGYPHHHLALGHHGSLPVMTTHCRRHREQIIDDVLGHRLLQVLDEDCVAAAGVAHRANDTGDDRLALGGDARRGLLP
jgi:hypothetical protein